jgi:hypothetical protein
LAGRVAESAVRVESSDAGSGGSAAATLDEGKKNLLADEYFSLENFNCWTDILGR